MKRETVIKVISLFMASLMVLSTVAVLFQLFV